MESVRNPYNRNIIPEAVIKNIKSIIRFSTILKIHIDLDYEDDTKSQLLNNIFQTHMKDNKELKELLIEQNNKLLEICNKFIDLWKLISILNYLK